MQNKNKRNKVNVVYSTNPEFVYEFENRAETVTVPPQQQDLRVMTDRKNRGGKTVTLVTGFVGRQEDCEALGRLLKTKCGTGGSVKDQEIIIQGDFKEKVFQILSSNGYKVKRSGG